MVTGNNTYLTDLVNHSHEMEVTCGDDSVPLSAWQHEYSQDEGSAVGPSPSAKAIVGMAKQKLMGHV